MSVIETMIDIPVEHEQQYEKQEIKGGEGKGGENKERYRGKYTHDNQHRI